MFPLTNKAINNFSLTHDVHDGVSIIFRLQNCCLSCEIRGLLLLREKYLTAFAGRSKMEKILKRTGKIILILLCIVLIFLSTSTIYHHISLSYEKNSIISNGTLVEVEGHKIHIYAEGDKGSKPTLVFMSGSGTVAPVYDFKSLYSILSHEYRIAVVEKAGYGYSQIIEVERDIDTMLGEVRQGLSIAGEEGPYVLFPHSMSGLEAIAWAQQYPDEVKAIVGLDMAVPESYDFFNFSSVNQMMYVGRAHLFGWGFTGFRVFILLITLH